MRTAHLSRATTLAMLCLTAGCSSGEAQSDTNVDSSDVVVDPNALTCTALTVEAGAIGSGQSARALATKDLSGTKDTWSKYVEFAPATRAICTMTLPAGKTVNDVTSLTLNTNYRGPSKAEMRWTFEAWNVQTSAWELVGDNASATSWVWSASSVALTGDVKRFVGNGVVKMRYATTSQVDASQLDLWTLAMNASGTPAPPPPPVDAGTPVNPPPPVDAGTPTPGTDGGAVVSPTPTGAVFYVSPSGNDANSGAIDAPWKTLGKAMKTVTAGATVRARAGVYGERVSITTSGTATAPITLESYPNEVAVVDGTGVSSSNGGGLVTLASVNHIIVRNMEVRNFTTSTSSVPAGIEVSGSSTDIQLLGNRVHDIVTTVGSCNGNGGNAFGIQVYGTATTPISQLVIHANELYALKTGCSESMTINGNVDGFEVSNNVVHDNDNIGIDVIGYESTGPTTALDSARNGVIRQNSVYNITSKNNPAYNGETSADGIYVDGGHNVLIEQNIVHNVDIGIEVASEHAGKASSYVLVRNNVVYYSNLTGLAIGGYDAQRGSTDHTMFLGNTLYQNKTTLLLQFHLSDDAYENNIAYESGGGFTDGSTTGIALDHNVQASSNAANVFANPGTPSNGAVPVDLRVAAGTLGQVRNAGVALACPAAWTCPAVWGSAINGATDVSGAARVAGGTVDIGAYEMP